MSHLLTELLIDRLKREAHRATWYSQTSGPLRRASTWAVSGNNAGEDVEKQSSRSQGMRVSSLESSMDSRPQGQSRTGWSREDGISRRPFVPNPILENGSRERAEMRGGIGEEQSSEDPVLDSQWIGGLPGSVQRPRPMIGTKFIHGHDTNTSDKTGSTSLTSKSSTSKKREPFTLGNQLKATIFNSWINILLIAAPIGIALHFVNANPVAIFVVNFVAIIPLAALLSYATEEIAIRVGETLGGLLNASFGFVRVVLCMESLLTIIHSNAVELIVSIIALVKGQVVIVKTSLIGSILSNLLLVMGMSFFFGGIRRSEQFFNKKVSSTAASMLALAISSVIIPTAFDQFTDTTDVPIAQLSRGTAVILLVVYGCYLYFQLGTHSALYAEEGKKVPIRTRKPLVPNGGVVEAAVSPEILEDGRVGTDNGDRDHPQHNGASQEEQPQLHIWVAISTLAATTAVVAICAEFMVDSIDSITSKSSGGISVVFVGLILLPIIGNASEHATAVTVAWKDKMDLAIGVTLGSSMQIAVLVIPFAIILGWILGNDEMNLSFDGFQTAVLFVSVLLVNYVIVDGSSNWIKGVLLQCLYLIIAVTAWLYGSPFPRLC